MSKQGGALDGDGLCARHRVREAGLLRNTLTTVNIGNIRGRGPRISAIAHFLLMPLTPRPANRCA